jgi:hypothetical protein
MRAKKKGEEKEREDIRKGRLDEEERLSIFRQETTGKLL